MPLDKNGNWITEAQAERLKNKASQPKTIGSTRSWEPEPEGIGSKAKRIAGAAVEGLAKGATEIGALAADIVLAPKDYIYTKEIMPRTREFDNLWEETSGQVAKDIFGLKDTTAENIVGGMTELIPSIAVSGGINKLAGITPMAEDIAAAATKKLGNNLLGKAASSAIKDTPDMLTTYLMTEAPKEEKVSLPLWGAEWIGGNLALKGIGMGLKAGLGKLQKAPSAEEIPADIDFMVKPAESEATTPEPVKPEYASWFNEEAFNRNRQQQAQNRRTPAKKVQCIILGGHRNAGGRPTPFHGGAPFRRRHGAIDKAISLPV